MLGRNVITIKREGLGMQLTLKFRRKEKDYLQRNFHSFLEVPGEPRKSWNLGKAL